MATITFLVRRKPIAVFQLSGVVTLGRSLDCDIYVPDVFVSRHHCRFERINDSWHLLDWESRNGVWCSGQRLKDYLLKPGDVIEVGTIAFSFNEGVPDAPSNPAPYGMGPGVTELMDTVFAHELRPSAYTKRQAARRTEFMDRVKHRLAHPAERDVDVEPPADPLAWARHEWTELDLELQIAESQELALADWEPPIFDSPRRAGGGNPADQQRADYQLSGTAKLTRREVMALVERGARVLLKEEEEAAPVARPRRSLLASAGSLIKPFSKKEKPLKVVDGCKFETFNWRDRLVDNLRQKYTRFMGFARLNPAMAAGVVLGVVLLLGVAIRFSPVANGKGPHVYVPPPAEASAVKVSQAAK